MVPVGGRDGTVDGGRFARLWPLLWIVWLPNFSVPLTTLFREHPTPLRLVVVLGGAALFVAVYLWGAWQSALSHRTYPTAPLARHGWWPWGLIAVLAGLSVALTVGDGPDWLALFIFTSASVGGLFALRRALGLITVLVVLAGLLGWLAHRPMADVGQAMFWTAMAGILVIIVNHLRQTNLALRRAREEVARLAVEAERLRFARDLHDLLGHDLARIALQSEVVEALIRADPARAAATAREVGATARTALQEVRAAVAGYRQPTLASELQGAQELLAAAGIAYRFDEAMNHAGGLTASLPPAVEAVLAWAVREGVTNVVKHSRARHCTIRTAQDAHVATVEVSDDGRGTSPDAPAPSPGQAGHGLAGLAERVAALGGRCETGSGPAGGFRLSVVVPVAREAGVQSALVRALSH